MSISASAPTSCAARSFSPVCAIAAVTAVADFIEQLADDGTLFLGERLHLLAPCRDAPAASEITDAHGVERLLVRNSGDFRQCGGAEFVQRVAHAGTLNRYLVKSAIRFTI